MREIFHLIVNEESFFIRITTKQFTSLTGIPPVLYLTLNRTIRNEVRELILKIVCIDITRLSHQTQVEVRNIAGMERNENNDEEMLELQVIS